MRLPFSRIQAPVVIKWHQKVVTLLAFAAGMALLAGEQQPDVPEFWCEFFHC